MCASPLHNAMFASMPNTRRGYRYFVHPMLLELFVDEMAMI